MNRGSAYSSGEDNPCKLNWLVSGSRDSAVAGGVLHLFKSRTLRHISSSHKTYISGNQHFQNTSAAGFVDTGLFYFILWFS